MIASALLCLHWLFCRIHGDRFCLALFILIILSITRWSLLPCFVSAVCYFVEYTVIASLPCCAGSGTWSSPTWLRFRQASSTSWLLLPICEWLKSNAAVKWTVSSSTSWLPSLVCKWLKNQCNSFELYHLRRLDFPYLPVSDSKAGMYDTLRVTVIQKLLGLEVMNTGTIFAVI